MVAEFGVAPGPEAALQVDTWGPQPRRVERGAQEAAGGAAKGRNRYWTNAVLTCCPMFTVTVD